MKKAKESGKLAFDADTFRLDTYRIDNHELYLEVSNLRFSKRKPLKDMVSELIPLGEAYFPKGMSIGGFIKTTDDKYIFGQRNGRSLTKTTQDFIGGIVQPEKLDSGRDLFGANYQEIDEELNIPKSKITSMCLLGVVLSNTSDVICVMDTHLSLTLAEVNMLFRDRKDAEMDSIVVIEKKALEQYMQTLGGYKPCAFTLFQSVYSP